MASLSELTDGAVRGIRKTTENPPEGERAGRPGQRPYIERALAQL